MLWLSPCHKPKDSLDIACHFTALPPGTNQQKDSKIQILVSLNQTIFRVNYSTH
jgi:hypothetical protein